MLANFILVHFSIYGEDSQKSRIMITKEVEPENFCNYYKNVGTKVYCCHLLDSTHIVKPS